MGCGVMERPTACDNFRKTAEQQRFPCCRADYWNRYPFSTRMKFSSSPGGKQHAAAPCAILPQGGDCFVAVNLPVKPRTEILPLITASEVRVPSNVKTAGPAFQLHATFCPETVARV